MPLSRLRAVAVAMATVVIMLGLLVSATGSQAATPNKAALTAATTTRYKCGAQCNGKLPTWKIPSNGVACVNSEKLVRSVYATSINHSPVLTDTGIVVNFWYSPVCQTMWMTIHSNWSAYRYSVILRAVRQIWPGYSWTGHSLPAVRTTWTSPMFDDSSPTYGAAGYDSVQYNMNAVTYYVVVQY